MSAASSDFDFEIDDDDLQGLDIAEQEALSNLQLSSAAPPAATLPSSSILPVDSPRRLEFNGPNTTNIQSPRRTLPWNRPVSSLTAVNPGQQVKGRSRANEPKTHHYIDTTAAKTCIYPTNVSFREYQFNIVQRALFDNVLVSLPTGLGKTFIAATVMFNYYRWFPRSKIVFVAPTKPLVSQQVEACFKICGVPYSHTAQLTGTVLKPLRATAYEERRVFYMTPQTLENDLRSGICDAKSIVCLVIDEAHRGTGNYAYGGCVALIRKSNPSVRILALSATPGATIDAVQNVINALCIARVEIRIEESMDLRPYLHKRKTELITLPLGPEITSLRDLFAKVIQKYLDRLKNLNDPRLRDPLNITLYGVKTAGDTFLRSATARNANPAFSGMVRGVLGILASLAHALGLLTFHGIQPFYDKLLDLQTEYEAQGRKLSKTKTELLSNNHFQELMTRLKVLVDNPNTVGHPKLDRAANMIIEHFIKMDDQKQDTRVMVFAQYRGSAAELVKQLSKQEPLVKPTIFVGQATDTRGGAGMKQSEQLDVIQKFKNGHFNVLVATSIGEEGLDIGDVDLIICYDTSSSPVRMLQRMGRTGRKREGRVVFLLTEGKEERDHVKSQDAYEKIQKKIAAGNEFEFDLDNSPRILPPEFQPNLVKKEIIPPNETLEDLELKVDRRKKIPKRTKDWSLPENAETGFVKASVLGARKRQNSENANGLAQGSGAKKRRQQVSDEDNVAFVDPETLRSPFMSKEDEERVRRQRVHVSPTPPSMIYLDTKSRGSIPAGSVRKRLVSTRKGMKNPTRAQRTIDEDDIEELTSTPPNLLASESPVKKSRLTPRNVNKSRGNDPSSPISIGSESPPRLFKGWDDGIPSTQDDEELPDLSESFKSKGIKSSSLVKGSQKIDSDEEYGLPSEFNITPKKRIRITLSSDEDE